MYWWIIFSLCAVHDINLFLEVRVKDIGKMAFFKEIQDQGKAVVIWIREHQAFAAKFSKLTSK
jgi:hypothetical protein